MGASFVVVEYDKMAGTAFPLPETVGGSTVTVSSIYDKVGIKLTVIEDDTSIPRLLDPVSPSDPYENDFITPPEIDNVLMAGHRRFPIGPVTVGRHTRYHVYGIVVDHYFQKSDGTKTTTMMGVTLTSPAGNQRPFAIFYRNANISGSNAKFLRTTAHEIGHVFNLHHEDGDGRKSIMNTSETVGNRFDYRFVRCEKSHLKCHPKVYVWPEVMPKSSVDSLHPHSHTRCR